MGIYGMYIYIYISFTPNQTLPFANIHQGTLSFARAVASPIVSLTGSIDVAEAFAWPLETSTVFFERAAIWVSMYT